VRGDDRQGAGLILIRPAVKASARASSEQIVWRLFAFFQKASKRAIKSQNARGLFLIIKTSCKKLLSPMD
jgi:hypothetical protein